MKSSTEQHTPVEYQNYLTDHLSDAYGSDHDRASRLKTAYHLNNILPHVCCPSGDDILEIGPGYGEMLSLLINRGFKSVTAVDISPEVVSHVNRFFGRNICVHSVNLAGFLAERQDKYGCIILLDVLEHIPKDDVIPLLKSIRVALKRGGRIIIQTPNASSPFSENLYFSDFTHQWNYTEYSIRQVLSGASFTHYLVHGYRFPKGPVGMMRSILRRILHLRYYLGAIVSGIVRVKILDPNLVAVATK